MELDEGTSIKAQVGSIFLEMIHGLKGNLKWAHSILDEYPRESLLNSLHSSLDEFNSLVVVLEEKGQGQMQSTLSTSILSPNHFLMLDVKLFAPFIGIIRSGEVNGPITIVALQCIEKMIRIFDEFQQDKLDGVFLNNLITSVTHCKFEASESSTDEVVLVRILILLSNLVCHSILGKRLSDESICFVMETIFSMCFQAHSTEILRKTAEHYLSIMISHLFKGLRFMDATSENDPNQTSHEIHNVQAEKIAKSNSEDLQDQQEISSSASNHELSSDLSPTATLNLKKSLSGLSSPTADEKAKSHVSLPDANVDEKPAQQKVSISTSIGKEPTPYDQIKLQNGLDETVPEPVDVKPFGVASLREIFRFLASLIDQHRENQKHNTDSMRLLGIRIISIAVNDAGPSISRFPSISAILRLEIFRNLFLIFQGTDNLTLLRHALRCSLTLFTNLLPVLKCHMEFHLSLLLERLTALNVARLKPLEMQESILEHLYQLCRIPNFICLVYVNYDCDVRFGNIYENLITFLYRNMISDTSFNNQLTHVHVLCLDIIVEALKTLSSTKSDAYSKTLYDEMVKRRELKAIISKGVDRINVSFNDGMMFFKENKIVSMDAGPMEVARFLKNTPNISKKMIGEVLGKPENVPLLKAFISDFNFKGLRLDEALRMLAESFRLPGESQQIDRILDNFANTYYQSNKNEKIKSQDAAFILSFSIIMLNTDQHNSQVKRKMTLQDFIKNIRGVNDGGDFDPDYLKEIYDCIKGDEIIFPEEHAGAVGFRFAWKEMLRRDVNAGTFVKLSSFDIRKDMFAIIDPSIVSYLGTAYEHCQSNRASDLVINAISCLTKMSDLFGSVGIVDACLMVLIKNTRILADDELTMLKEQAVEATSAISYSKEELIGFISSNSKMKSLLSAIAFIVIHYPNQMKDSWRPVISLIIKFLGMGLLPDKMLECEDFIKGSVSFVPASKTIKSEKRDSSSLFSTLSMYLMGGGIGDGSREDSEAAEDETNMKKARQVIKDIDIENMFRESKFYGESSLVALLEALRDVSISLLQKNSKRTIPVILCLELMVEVCLQNRDRILIFWPIIMESIEGLLDKRSRSINLIDRLVVNLLRLSIRMVNNLPALQEPFYQVLGALLSLPEEYQKVTVGQISQGLIKLLRTGGVWILDEKGSLSIRKIIAILQNHSQKDAFDVVSVLVMDPVLYSFSAEYFSECVDFLVFFTQQRQKDKQSSDFVNNARDSGEEYDRRQPLRISFEGGDGSDSVVTPNPNSNGGGGEKEASMERAVQSVEKLFKLFLRIPVIVGQKQISGVAAWSFYWLPCISGFCQQCCHRLSEVRQISLIYLQRALLSPELAESLTSENWVECFELVLFPLLDSLMQPQHNYEGISETRIRAAALVCRIFLQNLTKLHDWPGLPEIWMRLLDILELFYKNAESELLATAVRESLKNMLLVIHSNGIFAKGSVWEATWVKIDGIWPKLRNELTDIVVVGANTRTSSSDAAVDNTPESAIPVNNDVNP